jgi:hypothetical protein
MSLPERDWRVIKAVHSAALDRYCRQVLDECSSVIASGGDAHGRYARLFQLLRDRDDRIAVAIDGLRRSTAIHHLTAMIGLGLVTDAELRELTEPTRDAALAAAALYRPRKDPPSA